MLFEARYQIYNSLMLHDLYKSNFMAKTISKQQWLSALTELKNMDLKISYEKIFNVKKEDIQIEKTIDIPNPKILYQAYFKNCDLKKSKFPERATGTYNTTLMYLAEAH